MSFYRNWFESKDSNNETLFIKQFLTSANDSMKELTNGAKEDLIAACQILLKTSIKLFVDNINSTQIFEAKDVIQYSNLDHAIFNVSACCEFSVEGLTFTEIGRQIMHSKLEGACKKYGENHAKLAAEFSLVKLEKNKSYYVFNTAFGTFSLSLSKEDKYELVKRLALRNKFIQSLIFEAKKGMVSYSDLALKVLSESTMERRKSNVKQLVMLILEKESIRNNIIW